MAMIRSLVAVLLVAGLFVCRSDAEGNTNVKVPADVIFQPDLIYGKAGKIPLMLDLALPKGGKGPYPAILIFHGTGPGTGGRTAMREYTLALAQRGFAALAVGFRHECTHAFPAAFDDTLAAQSSQKQSNHWFGKRIRTCAAPSSMFGTIRTLGPRS